jgi:hypothetical protein
MMPFVDDADDNYAEDDAYALVNKNGNGDLFNNGRTYAQKVELCMKHRKTNNYRKTRKLSSAGS